MLTKPWYTFWPKYVPRKLQYPSIPLFEILRKTARENPEDTAISFGKIEFPYSKLEELCCKFASALVSMGVKKGDRVGLFLPNIPQFIIAYYGILKAGAVATTISPLHKEREVEYQLNDSGAETIVTLDSLHSILENIWPKTKLKNEITTNLNELNPQRISKSKCYPFQQILDQDSNPPKIKIAPSEDLAALQYTGGTTGLAKGAMLTHTNLVTNALGFGSWIRDANAKETFLTALPLFHIYGMTTSMNVPISFGAKMVLLPRFDTTIALEAIEKHRVTVFCGVPTMYAALLANPKLNKFDLSSIRVCISGASTLPPYVQKRFMEITGGFLAEGYGLTEASPVTHCNPVDKTMKSVRVGSIGLPLSDTDACILDLETGTKEMKPGEIGELAVRGPQIMKGYWGKPRETESTLCRDWLLTGDIGKMDQEGYFYITDRKKDLIKYKDYSVYPRELEDLLYEHPAVQLCSVIGKHDELSGEIPKAFVVLKENAKTNPEELMQFVEERVAPYKRIREIEFREELPLSPAGKVLKRVLKEEERNRNS